MRPDNEFTTGQQRFFYPINNEAEHHETLDTSEFPDVLHIEGKQHFVIIAKDGAEQAYDPHWGPSNIPEGWTVTQVAGLAADANRHQTGGILEGRHLAVIDRSKDSYAPQAGEQVVVRLNQMGMRGRISETTDIPEDGVFILPHDAPMPTAAELGLGEDIEAYYEFIGFIDTEDKLVIPNYLMNSPMRKVADWCVANAVAQNRLEHALLLHDLPREATLTGMLQIEPKITAYLKYFDEKHGTSYFPEKDPQGDHDRFPRLTKEQQERYSFLVDTAHRFLTEPRH